MAEAVIRKINVGRITGLSSYELAVKHGFTGTEEEYVNKETELYNKLLELSKNIASFSEIRYGDKSIHSSFDNNTINIETDDCLDVELIEETNTVRIKLKNEFRDSIVYASEKEDAKS